MDWLNDMPLKIILTVVLVVVPFIAGWYAKKTTDAPAFAGAVIGFLCAILLDLILYAIWH